MKVAISAAGPSLDSIIDPRFGRCSWFILVETDDMSFEAMENHSAERGGGAGIHSAQLVAQVGATAVLTGHCGPNAHKTLDAAGIDLFVGCEGTVADAIAGFDSGSFTASTGPDVASHAGLGDTK